MIGEDQTVRAQAVRFKVDPRDVPPEKAARKLGLTLARFADALPRLRDRGFPPPDPDTGNFDLVAIEAWMDLRSGLAKAGEPPESGAGDFGARLRLLRGPGKRR